MEIETNVGGRQGLQRGQAQLQSAVQPPSANSGQALAQALGVFGQASEKLMSGIAKNSDTEDEIKATAKFNDLPLPEKALVIGHPAFAKESAAFRMQIEGLDIERRQRLDRETLETELRNKTLVDAESIANRASELRRESLKGIQDTRLLTKYDQNYAKTLPQYTMLGATIDGQKQLQVGQASFLDKGVDVLKRGGPKAFAELVRGTEGKTVGYSHIDTAALLIEAAEITVADDKIDPAAKVALLKQVREHDLTGKGGRLGSTTKYGSRLNELDDKVHALGIKASTKSLEDKTVDIGMLIRSGDRAGVEAFSQKMMADENPVMSKWATDRYADHKLAAEDAFKRLEYQRAVDRAKLDKELAKAQDKTDAVQAATIALAKGETIQNFVGSNTGHKFPADEMGALVIQQRITQMEQDTGQPATFAQKVDLHVRSNIKDAVFERELGSGVNKLNSVMLDKQGKPVGTLDPEAAKVYENFGVARKISDTWVKGLTGESNYKLLMEIDALRGRGVDLALAAGLVNQGNRRDISVSDMGKWKDSVAKQMAEIENPPVFSMRNFSEMLRGEWGEGTKNLTPVRSALQSLAVTYMRAGVASDGKEAVQMASKYFKESGVVVQVNNTLYMRKDLPSVPQGEDIGALMSRYVSEKIGKDFADRGLQFRAGDITLSPQDGGDGVFQVLLGNIPIKMYHTKDQMEEWFATDRGARTEREMNENNAARYNPANGPPSIYADKELWKAYRDYQKSTK